MFGVSKTIEKFAAILEARAQYLETEAHAINPVSRTDLSEQRERALTKAETYRELAFMIRKASE